MAGWQPQPPAQQVHWCFLSGSILDLGSKSSNPEPRVLEMRGKNAVRGLLRAAVRAHCHHVPWFLDPSLC